MSGPTLGWLSAQLGVRAIAASAEKLCPVSIDTRRLQSGDTFWALRGATDGHDFVRQAFAQGAKAAVVNADWAHAAGNSEYVDRCIVVDDTRKALTTAGTMWRHDVGCRIIGITGSNGKTSTKEVVASLLRLKYRVTATEGNFNNRLGVPLTLLRLAEDTEVGVIEMGASEPGEIGDLCELCAPTHGLVTSIGKAHLEGFGTLAALAHTKGQLYDYVAETGVAFVPLDDELCRVEASGAHRAIGYSFNEHFNNFGGEIFRGQHFSSNEFGCASFTFGGQAIQLMIPGYPAALSALAALTIASCFGVPSDEAAGAVRQWQGAPGRGQVLRTRGLTIIDDCYNANPTSMRAALQTLCTIAGRRIAVLGEMAELGDYSSDEHAKLSHDVQAMQIDTVVLVGANWVPAKSAVTHCDSADQAAQLLSEQARPGDVILVKGSRSVGLERVVNKLVADAV